MIQPHDDTALQRAERETRALLTVFDTQAPPDFQEQVMKRVHARPQLQEHQTDAARSDDGDETLAYRIGRVSAALAAGLLLTGTAFYAARVVAPSHTAGRAPVGPSRPPAGSGPHATSPGSARPQPLSALVERFRPGAALPASAASTLSAEAAALASPPPSNPSTLRRQKRGLRRSGSEPRRNS